MYSHTQFGTVIVSFLGAGILLLLVVAGFAGWHPMQLAVMALLVVVLFLFHSLTVEVTTDQLMIRFGPGLIHKNFPMHQIREVRVARSSWFYGWGIRWTPHGWLYTVSGLNAVQIKLENGRQYMIGTDQPEELLRVLGQAIPRDSRHKD